MPVPGGHTRKPLGRALREVIGPRGEAATRREERAPSAGLLAHPARAALFQLLLDCPFSNVAQVAAGLGTTAPTARWHLTVLEEAGLLQTRREGRSLVAAVTGSVDARHAPALRALRLPHALALLRAVNASPGLALGEAARAAAVSPQSAARAVERLEGVAFVERVSDGRSVRVYPGPGLDRLVEERAEALPDLAGRVQAALEAAGEHAAVVRRRRGEVTLAVGRRGARTELALRSEGPLLPGRNP